jgi:hypothetical protein
VLSVDAASVTMLEGLNSRPFSGVSQAVFPFSVPSQRGRNRKKRRGGQRDMVSTISFIQANLQHSTAASGIHTKGVGDNGIDMALIQEPWYRERCIRGLNIPGYTLYPLGGKDRPRACILARNMNLWVLRISFAGTWWQS